LTRFIPGKESKELRIMAISHNREIQSSSTTDSNIAPTCESIDQLTCPLSIALVISAARNRPSQKSISYQLNSGQAPTKASSVPRHIAISCRMPSQAA
jgi:hypothetical protein